MRVISRKALRMFWKEHAQAESPLQSWYKIVRHSEWNKFADVRASFASADQVNPFVVFNIGGNKYRLVAFIDYQWGKLFIRHVLTHKDMTKTLGKPKTSAARPRAKGNGRKNGESSYLGLVRRVPLRPIRSEAELDRAIDMINELIDRPERDVGAQDYLDVLSDLVEIYEDQRYPMPPVSNDAEALRLLIEAKGITQQELSKAVGISNSTISAILHGQRRLSRGHIEALTRYCSISPDYFLASRLK